MKEFLGHDYLLESPLAEELYQKYAAKMPIFDFHCHLSPKLIAENHRFQTITEAWLKEDHYKWRLMREMGIEEKYITGEASDKEKFMAFAKTVPYFIGNPIYEWCHLELKTYFGIDKPLNESTAEEIYQEANEKLSALSCRQLLLASNVKELFTTDDPLDDLLYHQAIQGDATFPIIVRPCFRPDALMKIENGDSFRAYIARFETVENCKISDIFHLFTAISHRLDYFEAMGCVAADHDLADPHFVEADIHAADIVYQKVLKGKTITEDEKSVYLSALLSFLGKEYARRGWVMELHIGALRNVSKRAYLSLGKDSGIDSINDINAVGGVAAFLSHLDEGNALPKTVLYALNEKDYGPLSTLVNDFTDMSRGKIQFGAAWWFNDHYEGIYHQLKQLSSVALLSCFIGMLTDSRSFLSYTRHDYFRRVLCSYIAKFVEDGRYPNDMDMVGKIIEDICYNNAKEYFDAAK